MLFLLLKTAKLAQLTDNYSDVTWVLRATHHELDCVLNNLFRITTEKHL